MTTPTKKVEIRFNDSSGRWKIYWSGTDELADDRDFATLEEAGPVARELMGYQEPRRPALQRIG